MKKIRILFPGSLLVLAALSACAEPHPSPARSPVAMERLWVLPGEFEPVDEVLLGWDESVAPYFRETLAALAGNARITFVLDPSQDDASLQELIGEVRAVQFREIPIDVGIVDVAIDSLWLRDFGPMVTKNQGERRIVDLDYWGLGANDQLAEALATNHLGLQTDPVPLELEGGNLLVDGVGNCLVSTTVLAANLDRSAKEIRSLLRAHFGCLRTDLLPPLPGEQTGHVDMFLTFTAPGELIVGRGGPDQHEELNAHLEQTAARLRDGGYLVRTVPMPFLGDGLYRTYTNSLAVNGVVLVPYYSDTMESLQEALRVFQEAYPDRKIIPVESSNLIELNGAVHCSAMTTAR